MENRDAGERSIICKDSAKAGCAPIRTVDDVLVQLAYI